MGARYVMDGVSGMEGVEVDAAMYADHQRYFFCQAPYDLAISTPHQSIIDILLVVLTIVINLLFLPLVDLHCRRAAATRRARPRTSLR